MELLRTLGSQGYDPEFTHVAYIERLLLDLINLSVHRGMTQTVTYGLRVELQDFLLRPCWSWPWALNHLTIP